jgi:hypothetical protein
MAPAIMARLCLRIAGSWRYTAMPSVASATDGAAPNRPAKLLGRSTSPSIAKVETTAPNEEANDVFCHFVLFKSLASGPVDWILVWSTSLEASNG